MTNKKPTGTIFSRDYGIRLQTDGVPLFVSPSRYAFGVAQLQDGEQTMRMLETYARNNDSLFIDTRIKWQQKLPGRLGSDNLETISGRQAIDLAKKYGDRFTATVVSKDDRGPRPVQLGLSGDSYRCECPDDYWNDVKSVDALCGHAATLAVALAADKKSRLGKDRNFTGLGGKDLENAPRLPFKFNVDSVAELVVGYVVGGHKHADLSAKALTNQGIYTQTLLNRIANGTAQFGVLAQARQTADHDVLSESERRFYGAVRALEGRVVGSLLDGGFKREGHSLVFAGSEYEAVARRFRRGNEVVELATKTGEPPIIVRKTLARFSPNWIDNSDTQSEHPLKRSRYIGIDDATRREAGIEILRPGRDFPVLVADTLADRYRNF